MWPREPTAHSGDIVSSIGSPPAKPKSSGFTAEHSRLCRSEKTKSLAARAGDCARGHDCQFNVNRLSARLISVSFSLLACLQLAAGLVEFGSEKIFVRQGQSVFGGQHLIGQPGERIPRDGRVFLGTKDETDRWMFLR